MPFYLTSSAQTIDEQYQDNQVSHLTYSEMKRGYEPLGFCKCTVIASFKSMSNSPLPPLARICLIPIFLIYHHSTYAIMFISKISMAHVSMDYLINTRCHCL